MLYPQCLVLGKCLVTLENGGGFEWNLLVHSGFGVILCIPVGNTCGASLVTIARISRTTCYILSAPLSANMYHMFLSLSLFSTSEVNTIFNSILQTGKSGLGGGKERPRPPSRCMAKGE